MEQIDLITPNHACLLLGLVGRISDWRIIDKGRMNQRMWQHLSCCFLLLCEDVASRPGGSWGCLKIPDISGYPNSKSGISKTNAWFSPFFFIPYVYPAFPSGSRSTPNFGSQDGRTCAKAPKPFLISKLNHDLPKTKSRHPKIMGKVMESAFRSFYFFFLTWFLLMPGLATRDAARAAALATDVRRAVSRAARDMRDHCQGI